MNIRDYVLLNDNSTFDPHNPVDILAITQSAYFRFESESDLQLPSKIADLNIDMSRVHANRIRNVNHKFFIDMMHSDKFKEIEIVNFQSGFNTAEEMQFAAVTYRVNGEFIIVSFRGTDSTATGWKEDFNMSFSLRIPSQEFGVQYLNKIMGEYDLPVFVCGHSKGGNVAVYASSFCESQLKERIVKVYNFDGPGFNSSVIEDENYIEMVTRTEKYIPEASIIGKFMDSLEVETVIKSKQLSIFQHDVFNWIIEDGSFVEVPNISIYATQFSKSLQKIFESTNAEEREYVIDELYKSFSGLGIETFEGLDQFLSLDMAKNILSANSEVSPELKKYLGDVTKQFILNFIEFK